MSERRRGLGRGLGALIPSAPAEEIATDQAGDGPAAQPPGTATDVSPSYEVSVPSTESTPGENTGPGVDGADDTGSTDGAAGRISPEAELDAKSVAPGVTGSRTTEGDTGRKPDSGPALSSEAPATQRDEAATTAAETTSGPEQGRTPGAARGRQVSPAARQKAMKARMDMGEAFRGTSLGARPSDMFFLPSAPEAPAEAAADDNEAQSDGSRETRRFTGDGDRDSEVIVREKSDSGGVQEPTQASAPPPGPAGEGHVSRETPSGEHDLAAVPGATFAEVPVDAIHPNRKQPRQVFDEDELAELAYSIGALGVLQPIVVRPSRESGDASYELVMGERRWRAAQRAGLAAIPAIVRETADDSLLRDALLENLHRSQLNPLEEAAAYQQLMEEFGATQEELSRRIGRSRPQISNTIRLLRLPPLVQRRVAAGVLSSGHARALLSLSDPAEMERLAQRIVAEGLSVRATEEAVQLAEGTQRPPKRATPAAGRHRERLNYIADAFADRLDTSVKIALGARKGKMTIEFASVEDLNRIIEVLDPEMDRQ